MAVNCILTFQPYVLTLTHCGQINGGKTATKFACETLWASSDVCYFSYPDYQIFTIHNYCSTLNGNKAK